MPPVRIRLTAAVLAGTAVLAGCAQAQPAGPRPAPPLSAAALALVAADGTFAADEVLLRRADEELVRRCMTAAGHRYASPPLTGSPTDDDDHPDLAWRRRDGYSLSGAARSAPDTNDRHLATLPPAARAAWEKALLGDGSTAAPVRAASGRVFVAAATGCVADSARRLYGGTDEAAMAMNYPQDLRMAMAPRVREDPRRVAAGRAWTDCMRRRGHPYATPGDARTAMVARYRQGLPVERVRSEEIAVAVAAGECAVAAGLGTAAGAAARDLAVRMPADVRQRLDAAAASRGRAVARARAVLGRP
jgi:hypothetical protein